jgi:hypothetical protein
VNQDRKRKKRTGECLGQADHVKDAPRPTPLRKVPNLFFLDSHSIQENIERGEVLCVQRAVHFLGAKSDADEIDHHLQFPKEVLAKVLADPLMERAVRLLQKKGTPLADKENVPSMGQVRKPSTVACLNG